MDLFEKTVEACEWPWAHCPVRLIPLLSGEAQVSTQQLPMQNLLVYDDLKWAILQRVSCSAEQHRGLANPYPQYLTPTLATSVYPSTSRPVPIPGRWPREVLDVLREAWEDGLSYSKNYIQYILDL